MLILPVGGAQKRESCEEALARNETCVTHTLNRDIYPPGKDVLDTDSMTCYIPDSWLEK